MKRWGKVESDRGRKKKHAEVKMKKIVLRVTRQRYTGWVSGDREIRKSCSHTVFISTPPHDKLLSHCFQSDAWEQSHDRKKQRQRERLKKERGKDWGRDKTAEGENYARKWENRVREGGGDDVKTTESGRTKEQNQMRRTEVKESRVRIMKSECGDCW